MPCGESPWCHHFGGLTHGEVPLSHATFAPHDSTKLTRTFGFKGYWRPFKMSSNCLTFRSPGSLMVPLGGASCSGLGHSSAAAEARLSSGAIPSRKLKSALYRSRSCMRVAAESSRQDGNGRERVPRLLDERCFRDYSGYRDASSQPSVCLRAGTSAETSLRACVGPL